MSILHKDQLPPDFDKDARVFDCLKIRRTEDGLWTVTSRWDLYAVCDTFPEAQAIVRKAHGLPVPC